MLLMFNDIIGQREAIQKSVCTMPKKWQHLRNNSSQVTGVSWILRQRIHGGTQIHKNQRQCAKIALQMVDTFKCRTSNPIFPANMTRMDN